MTLTKDEEKWTKNNPVRSPRAVPLTDERPKKTDPTRGLKEDDRVVVSYLGKEIPGVAVQVVRRKGRVVVVRADDSTIPPINVFDGKYIRKEEL